MTAVGATQTIRAVLWVDDHPENHVQLIEQLEKKAISTAQEKTTDDALARLAASQFDLVVTDMHRTESGRVHHLAGMELITAVREQDTRIPIVVFFGRARRSVGRFRDAAIAAGANLVTASPTELMAAIEMPNKLAR